MKKFHPSLLTWRVFWRALFTRTTLRTTRVYLESHCFSCRITPSNLMVPLFFSVPRNQNQECRRTIFSHSILVWSRILQRRRKDISLRRHSQAQRDALFAFAMSMVFPTLGFYSRFLSIRLESLCKAQKKFLYYVSLCFSQESNHSHGKSHFSICR